MTDEQPPEDLGHAGAVVDKAIEYMVGQNIDCTVDRLGAVGRRSGAAGAQRRG